MTTRKPFDPALRRSLNEQAAASGEPPSSKADDERVRMARASLVRALESRTSITGLPNGVKTRELEIAPGLAARLYLPSESSEKSLPVMVYLHGGGWVAGSVATIDPFCRLLSEAAGVIIASVEYRLAPEHRYPAAVEDTLTAARCAAEHAGEWGGDASRLALGGDSAGGNLAAVAANQLRAGGEFPALRALMLLYPVTDYPNAGHLSYIENASGYGLEASQMRWFWQQYAPGTSQRDPTASPLQIQKVPSLPPTLVATAEYDVLRDEGIAYALKLKAAGVPVSYVHAADMCHNFPATPGLVGRLPQCNATLAEIAVWLKNTLALSEPTLSSYLQ